MTRLLLDSSVWLAWARSDHEPNHAAATSIVRRSRQREVELRLLDLTLYEIGNVVVRGWRMPAFEADGLVASVATLASVSPLVPSPSERRESYALADQHGLSVYDATYAAVARTRRLTLVSGDGALVTAGLAIAPADAA